MAIQNRDFPTVVKYEDFDPGKVNPGQIVIVDVLGMHAVFIGTSAGEAQRMAMYEEMKEFASTVKQAAAEAEQSSKNAAVLYELMQRKKAEVDAAAQNAKNQVEETADKAKVYAEKALKRAEIINQKAVDRAEDAAVKAEKAQTAVNKAMLLLQDTVVSTMSSFKALIGDSGEGRK